VQATTATSLAWDAYAAEDDSQCYEPMTFLRLKAVSPFGVQASMATEAALIRANELAQEFGNKVRVMYLPDNAVIAVINAEK
jgi:hypothetical protein